MKINRQKVYEKYDKRCAYCGKELHTIKDMQVDHIKPKMLVSKNYFRTIFNEPALEINDFDNLMPSCKRCNHYKRARDLEQFRELIKTLHERIRNNYINKVAEDFGIITVKEFSGKFYFEELSNEQPNQM